MDELTNITQHSQPTMSSREIATLCDKRHDNVMADIRKMLNELGLYAPDFSGTFITEQGNQYECFNLPKRECLILVSGYNVKIRTKIIDRWQQLEQTAPQPVQPIGEAEDKLRTIILALEHTTLSDVAKETVVITSAETLTGISIGYRPQIEQTTYSAKELGDVLGISANRVGRIANAHGLKTKEYGLYYLNKSQHSDKQVEHFRYFEKAIDKFKAILEAE